MKRHVPDPRWLAAQLASADQPALRPRLPLVWRQHVIGSVEHDYFNPLLGPASPFEPGLLRPVTLPEGPAWCVVGEDGTQALRRIAQALLAARVGCVARHWRDEQLAVRDARGQQVATVERGVVRPLGIATHAVHLVGRSGDGRFWVQQRALDKANDPGRWDTLMGGMVAAADTLASALARETWEEAGLRLAQLRSLAPGGRISLRRPAGDADGAGYVVEHIDWYHCTLPGGVVPENQDGEVARFELWTRAELLERLQQNQFTLEAALILAAALSA